MNYIKRLEGDIGILERRIAAAQDTLQGILEYLASEKFHCGDRLDGYVSTMDIIPTVQEIKRQLAYD